MRGSSEQLLRDSPTPSSMISHDVGFMYSEIRLPSVDPAAIFDESVVDEARLAESLLRVVAL